MNIMISPSFQLPWMDHVDDGAIATRAMAAYLANKLGKR